MNFDWAHIIGFALLALGVMSFALIILCYLDEQNIRKSSAQRYFRQNQEPTYTEEERFYADLLLKKNELDADAFQTRKDMFDEALKHQIK